jgi:hypothetical protein
VQRQRAMMARGSNTSGALNQVLEWGWGNAKEDMAGGGRDRGKGSDAAALPENDTGSSRANVVVKQEYDDDTGGSGDAMQLWMTRGAAAIPLSRWR